MRSIHFLIEIVRREQADIYNKCAHRSMSYYNPRELISNDASVWFVLL